MPPAAPFCAENSQRDTLIVGLICCGVALPLKIVVEELLGQGNEPEVRASRCFKIGIANERRLLR
jgi:hypothetical protein